MLSDEIKEWIIDFVRHRFDERRPPRFAELEQEFADRFGLYIKSVTVRHIVYNQIAELRITNAIPTEAQRAYARSEEIIAWYENLNKILEKIQRQFVFNVDEVGFSEPKVGSKRANKMKQLGQSSQMIWKNNRHVLIVERSKPRRSHLQPLARPFSGATRSGSCPTVFLGVSEWNRRPGNNSDSTQSLIYRKQESAKCDKTKQLTITSAKLTPEKSDVGEGAFALLSLSRDRCWARNDGRSFPFLPRRQSHSEEVCQRRVLLFLIRKLSRRLLPP
jgi:hypothetical protein